MSSRGTRKDRTAAGRSSLHAGLGVALCAAALAAHAAEASETPTDDPDPALATASLSAPTQPATAFVLARGAARPDAAALRLSLEGSVESLDAQRPQVLQGGGVATTLVDVSNRVWLGWGRAAFGLGFGAQTPRIDAPLGLADAQPAQAARPSVSVGLRYAFTPSSQFYAGASAARAWGTDDDLPRYNAKAGVEWKVARSRIGFDGGRLGVQLDSGYRMSIRTRSGGVQLALRRTF